MESGDPVEGLAAAATRMSRRLAARAPSVAILCGPASAEDRLYFARTRAGHRSSADIAAELGRLGASSVTMIDITENRRWSDALHGTDLVIINLHGSPGEDGTIQGLLRSRSIAFVGSDVEASVLALNKYTTKLIAHDVGVPTPRSTRWGAGSADDPVVPGSGPLIWKPLRGGSSLATQVLPPGARPPEAEEWLIEEYLEGEDVTVAVVEVAGIGVALPGVVLRHGGPIYDLDSKVPLDRSASAVACRPTELQDVLRTCERWAVRMHAALGAAHFSRSDFVVRDGEAFFLELNTLPGISAASNVTECARAAGLSYTELIGLIVGAAIEGRPRGYSG